MKKNIHLSLLDDVLKNNLPGEKCNLEEVGEFN